MKIGQSPNHFETYFYNSGLNDRNDATHLLSTYEGQVILLSCVDQGNNPNPGTIHWQWLSRLENIKNEIDAFRTAEGIATGFQPLAVVTNYINAAILGQALDTLSPVPSYPALQDAGNVAQAYQGEFNNDNSFGNYTPTDICSFIITDDFIVSDKWHHNTGFEVPISFNNLKFIQAQLNLSGLSFPNDGDNVVITLQSTIRDRVFNPLSGTNSITITYQQTTSDYAVNVVHSDFRKIAKFLPGNGDTITGAELNNIRIICYDDVIGLDDLSNYDIQLNGGITGSVSAPVVSSFADFDRGDYDSTQFYVTQRIKNILMPPKILFTVPNIGDSIDVNPSQDIKIIFSKPVGDAATDVLGPYIVISDINNLTNYPCAGGAGIDIEATAVSYLNNGLASSDPLNVGAIENEATLTVSLKSGVTSLGDGTVQVDVNSGAAAADMIKEPEASGDALENNFSQTYFTISYNGPEVDTMEPVEAPSGNPLTDFDDYFTAGTITITFTDNVTKASSPGTDLDENNINIDITNLTKLNSGDTDPSIGSGDVSKDSDNQYTVTINDISGLEASGSFDITFTDIADNYGNELLGDTAKTYNLETIIPRIEGVSSTTNNGSYNDVAPDEDVNITINFSKDVTLNGTLEVTLNSGASFDITGDGSVTSDTMSDDYYNITDGDNTPDGDFLEVTDLELTSGTLRDAQLHDADLSSIPVNIYPNKEIIIDTLHPTIDSIETDASGTIGEGASTTITITFSEKVILAGGNLQCTLNATGTTQHTLTQASDEEFEFIYDVSSGESANPIQVTDVSLTAGTLQDEAENGADLTTGIPFTVLDTNGDPVVVDTTSPLLDEITSITADGNYTEFDNINIRVKFNLSVTPVDGYLAVTINSSPDFKVPVFAATYPATVFNGTYTVLPGHATADLDSVSISLVPYNISITPSLVDSASSPVTLPDPIPTEKTIAYDKSIVITAGGAPEVRQIVLALDYSGSMGPDNPPITIGMDTREKIDWVRPAIKSFLDKVNFWAGSADECGIVFYHSVGEPYNGGTLLGDLDGAASLSPPSGSIYLLKEAVDGHAAYGSTRMGAGMANALNMLGYPANAGTARYIILYADGQQNRSPYIVFNITPAPDDQDDFTINTPGYTAYGCPDMGLVTVTQADENTIPIHTIGIGNNPTWIDTLMNLAHVGGGVFTANEESWIWPGVENSLTNLVQTIYGGSSPQILKIEQQELQTGNESYSDTITINQSVTKIYISVSWVGDIPLEFQLTKNGSVVEPSAPPIEEPNYMTQVYEFTSEEDETNTEIFGFLHELLFKYFDLLKLGKTRRIESMHHKYIKVKEWFYGLFPFPQSNDGEYTIVIKRKNISTAQGDVSFNLTVMVDEEVLEMTTSDQSESMEYFTSQRIPLNLHINELGEPLETVYSIEADIRYPERAMSNILIENNLKNVRLRKPADTEMTALHQKTSELLQNKNVRDQVSRKRKDTVRVKSINSGMRFRRKTLNGIFKGYLPEAKVPGIYTIDYKIKGAGNLCGVFERQITRTVLVNTKPEARRTEFSVIYQGNELQVTFAPKDRYGNYLGPGFMERISCRLDTGKKTNPLRDISDNHDGSYTVRIKGIRSGDLKRHKLEIKAMGITIFNNPVSKIYKTCWLARLLRLIFGLFFGSSSNVRRT